MNREQLEEARRQAIKLGLVPVIYRIISGPRSRLFEKASAYKDIPIDPCNSRSHLQCEDGTGIAVGEK